MRYFNIISDYIPMLKRCVNECLWIKQGPLWYEPYKWATKFHATYMSLDFDPELKDPWELLAEADEIISQRPEPYASLLRLRRHQFKRRVIEYYESDKDARLLEALDRNVWPEDIT